MYTVILFWYVCNVTALFFSLQILFLEKFVGTNIRKKKFLSQILQMCVAGVSSIRLSMRCVLGFI